MNASEILKEVNRRIKKHDIKGLSLLFIEEDGVTYECPAVYGSRESIIDVLSSCMDGELCVSYRKIRDIVAGAIIKAESEGVEVFRKHSKISQIISIVIEDYCRCHDVKF